MTQGYPSLLSQPLSIFPEISTVVILPQETPLVAIGYFQFRFGGVSLTRYGEAELRYYSTFWEANWENLEAYFTNPWLSWLGFVHPLVGIVRGINRRTLVPSLLCRLNGS